MEDILGLESERQKELYSLNILDTESESAFQNLIELAALVTNCTLGTITLADNNRLWYKAKFNVNNDECDRYSSLCQIAMDRGEEVFEIPDLLNETRFKNEVAKKCSQGLRFYASKPLISSKGFVLGTVCVMDRSEKNLDSNQRAQLALISKQVVQLIELKSKFVREKDIVNKDLALFATLNHEMRTPVNSIIARLDILKQELESRNDSSSEQASAIHSTASHLVGLVNNSLDYLRLGAEQVKLDIATHDVRLSFKQIQNMLVDLANDNATNLNLLIDASVPLQVEMDQMLFKQIVINLASNAIKFTPGGDVKIVVGYDALNEMMNIDIIDNGLGMTSEEVENIFCAYSQANSAKKVAHKGSGLGLTITKELAKRFNGGIEVVESTIGLGSHFRASLNIASSKVVSVPKRNSLLTCFDGVKKILVVDDTKENLFLFRHYMKSLPFDIKDVQSSAEALRTYQEEDFDYVFLDIHLEYDSGIDLRKKMEIARPDNKTNFIAFTGSNSPKEIEEFISSGFHQFVSKPFDDKSILNALQ